MCTNLFDSLLRFQNHQKKKIVEMSTNISLDELRVELIAHPSRLEEMRGGYSPLMSSAKFGNLGVAEFLLSVGATIHPKRMV